MGLVILSVAAVGAILALASSGRGKRAAEKAVEKAKELPAPVKAVEQAPAAPVEVKAAVQAIKQGAVTPEVLSPAIDAARKNGLNGTAEALAKKLDEHMEVTVPALISSPDVPGGTWKGDGPAATASDVPTDPATGKTLWYPQTKGGYRMILPRFRSVLVQFQSLQRAIGVPDDGRIGNQTMVAFVKKARAAEFEKYPATLDALAANAVKWTEVLNKKYQPAQVGEGPPNPFEQVSDDTWMDFLERANADWGELVPRVQEKLGRFIGQDIGGSAVTLSGLLGLTARAGIRGAESWLKNAGDREKYPNSTKAFQATNGLF